MENILSCYFYLKENYHSNVTFISGIENCKTQLKF